MGQQHSRTISFKKNPSTISSGRASSLATSAAVESFPEGFRWIEGRGISDDAGPVYLIPNHSDDRARLNSQHYQIRFVLQNNQMAPVRKELRRGIKVLDAGCGTGIWSVEMARDYPKSDFTATDINSVFDDTIVDAPTNVRFMLANTLELPFEDDTFDYVFQRLQLGSFREKEWPQALQQLIRVTKPGGRTPLFFSSSFNNTSAIISIFNLKKKKKKCINMHTVHNMLGLRGIYPKFALTFNDAFEAAGLQNVQHDHRSIPVGWGPPEIASISAKNVMSIIEMLKPTITLTLGLSSKEYDEMSADCVDEFAKHKTYWNVQFAYGQKPLK
ncbi:S-adenosyl-L-methionine-dependent methyltransferase [Endogone sp. FLAS-F59071]|nr:S-adenosyl-L-methionine-dependent methyltransferase [Endogone sp. FLAS-F59071]|eukprot:RUS15066.1 S-adenosyl-L-methionine-dependent methyltransferase [Endogone sp. FLAS-F59071]